MELKQLSQLLPGWPDSAPQSLSDLVFAENEAIEATVDDGAVRDLVFQLRGHVRAAARQRGQSAQLASPSAIQEAFTNGDLVLVERKWLTLPLDRHRRRTFKPYSADSSRTVSKISRFVPDAADLPVLPEDGVYLMLWGGSPDVLEIDDVRQRLRAVQDAVPVCDVLFRQREKRKSTLWSLRQGFGCCGNDVVEFPNNNLAKEVHLWGS
jgi:hypothetical protein